METEEMVVDSTVIKFFNDYITADAEEIIKRDLDIAVINAIQKNINAEQL